MKQPLCFVKTLLGSALPPLQTHGRPILNPTGNYIHTAVSEHFLTSNHSDNHMLLIPIEKLKNGRDSFRKAREAHLIHKAETIEPLGISKRDEL